MLKNWPRPLVIGHRGASAHAPENTLASFELAIRDKADAIEFDVKLSADKKVIIIHDATVDRTTNGIGKVARLDLVALKELDAGGKFSEGFKGEKIPTLHEVFERFGKQILMNVELTNYSTSFDDLVIRVVELVKTYKVEDRVIFSSFLARSLRLARRLLPEVPCGLLVYSGWLGLFPRWFGWKKRFQALHPYLTDVNQALVQSVHGSGKRIHVWTVNGKEEIKSMLALNVDGIFTDDPGMLRRLMEKG
jgi:glycerophosphoryl diester phosphodiesterase